MKTKLIQIGNSMGIRLPRAVINECGFEKELELQVKQGALIVTPVVAEKNGWKELMQDEVLRHAIKAEGEWEW